MAEEFAERVIVEYRPDGLHYELHIELGKIEVTGSPAQSPAPQPTQQVHAPAPPPAASPTHVGTPAPQKQAAALTDAEKKAQEKK
jgi:hypothetical protein